MSGPDDITPSRADDQIEFFATLPSSVNPDDPEAVRVWLDLLGDALSGASQVKIREERPPGDESLAKNLSGAWFEIQTLGHPICPGRLPGDGDDPGNDPGDDPGEDPGGDPGDGGGDTHGDIDERFAPS